MFVASDSRDGKVKRETRAGNGQRRGSIINSTKEVGKRREPHAERGCEGKQVLPAVPDVSSTEGRHAATGLFDSSSLDLSCSRICSGPSRERREQGILDQLSVSRAEGCGAMPWKLQAMRAEVDENANESA